MSRLRQCTRGGFGGREGREGANNVGCGARRRLRWPLRCEKGKGWRHRLYVGSRGDVAALPQQWEADKVVAAERPWRGDGRLASTGLGAVRDQVARGKVRGGART